MSFVSHILSQPDPTHKLLLNLIRSNKKLFILQLFQSKSSPPSQNSTFRDYWFTMADMSVAAELQALMAQLQQQPATLVLDGKAKQITRRKFSPEEDDLLRRVIAQYGTNDWVLVAQYFQGRTPRQCRDRWKNYVSPEVVNGNWTPEAEQLLFSKVRELGSKWALIAQSFPGRTDIGVKNHYISMTRNKNPLGLIPLPGQGEAAL
jgi:hypothetical protein